MHLIKPTAVFALCFACLSVLAATDGTSVEQAKPIRVERKFGFQVINMGAPYSQMLGVSGGVNVTRQARARLIYAPGMANAKDTVHTLVASVDGFLFDRELTPMLSVQTAFSQGPSDINVFGGSARHFLVAVGADFLRSDGLNAGVAVNLPINEPVSGIAFYLGWYSDLF
ncbi:MAG: hypothetical protein HYR96_09930 [Deltaproteobacteria bacterium]|nr:hypothetical protein [Deltaproteobacteria bacterium]MBI3296048.1 hypothetical protein [Deltaproteobacteria bacterium]